MTIKLLIVDDEQIERDGIQAMLQRAMPELSISQARHGRHALEIVPELQPDIVLMDIKMPGISGLEAVELLKQEHPHIKFVMVTAYDTFDYAKTAIKLGVKDYLLKPSKASEIVATVQRVIDQLEEERLVKAKQNEQQLALERVIPVIETDLVTQLLYDHMHDVHIDELLSLLQVDATDEAFVITVLLPKGYEGLYPIMRQKIMQSHKGWLGALNGRLIPIVLFRDRERSYRNQATNIARELLQVVEQEQQYKLKHGYALKEELEGCYIGIGGICDSIHHIRSSYQEAMLATLEPLHVSKYQFYEDIVTHQSHSERLTQQQWEQQLIERVRQGQWEVVKFDVEEQLRKCQAEQVELHIAQQRVLELLWMISRVLIEMGVEVETPIFTEQWSHYDQLRSEAIFVVTKLQLAAKAYQDRIKPDVIQQIKQYINEHADQQISLEMLSNHIELSPAYISKLFKEQLGVNYIDFLTQCRIEKAKKLMIKPELSMKEITYEVGYHDPNYFSKVFKKMSGVSPTEYRKSLFG